VSPSRRSSDRPICACGKRAYATKAEARQRFPKRKVVLCFLGHPVYHVKGNVSTRQSSTFAHRGGSR
jgi:hypothetical protein